MPGQLFCFEKPACFLFLIRGQQAVTIIVVEGALLCKERKKKEKGQVQLLSLSD